jgi:short-subunit dehydrogenase
VLITGASTGIGLALARRLIGTTDHHVVLTARSASLSRFVGAGLAPSDRVWIRALDVTSDDERRRVVREVDAVLGGVDALVNNAGVALRAVVEHVRETDRLRQMDVNFRAPMELARLVLPAMRARRAGRIVNVSSVAGMMAMPTMAAYAASKFALEGASEALWYEVRPFGIHVTLVQPGFVRSNGFEHVLSTSLSACSQDRTDDPYHAHYTHMRGFVERLMRHAPSTPEHVARVVARNLARRHPPLRVAGTLDAHFFALLRRLLPRGLYHALLYRSLPSVGRWGTREAEPCRSSLVDRPETER